MVLTPTNDSNLNNVMYRIIGANGKEYGPVTPEQLKQWIAEGRANLQSKVRPEGETEWKTLGEIPEISAAPPPPPTAGFRPLTGTTANVTNYLWQSIVITLCCCMPFGIVAIVYAAQVNTKLGVGDVAGAQDSSSKAKMWCWIGFGVGLVTNGIIAFLQIIAIVAGAADM
jgi:hypothetical protein